jgi:hypothetical protein
MSYSNYEQTVIINDHRLLGVQSVDGNYGISEKPVRVAGVGFIDALIQSPLQGNFSISRRMVGADPLIEKNSQGKYVYDEEQIEGVILYNNDTKGFGFTKGRVSRYSVSCSVGNIPEIQTEITVYGSLGKNVVTGQKAITPPPVKFPDQSSMRVTVSDFTIDAISDFSYSRAINTTPVYALPKGDLADWNVGAAGAKNLDPIQIDTQYPIEVDINFTVIADEYEIREIKDRIQAAPKSDVRIEIFDAQSPIDIINSYEGQNVRLISESIGSTVEGEMTISLTYKGYETRHNVIT